MSDANNNPDKKKFSLKKVAIIIISVILLFNVLILFMNIRKSESQTGQSKQEIDEKSYNSSKLMRVDFSFINSIKLNLKTCDVRIERSETNPYIEYTNLYRNENDSAYELETNINDGNLEVKPKISGKELNMKNKIPIIKIFVTDEDYITNLNIKLDSGNMVIKDLTIQDNTEIKVENGNISIKDSALKGRIKTVRGDIKFKNINLDNGKIETDSGNIEMKKMKLGNDVRVKTNTGNILLKSDQSISDYNLDARLDVGNFTLGNISYRNIKNGFSNKNRSQKFLSLTTGVGNIEFNKGEEYEIKKDKPVEEDNISVKEKLGDPLKNKNN